ncbi:MAG: DUF4446 family protein [Chloroflexota bacterium]
MDPIRTAYNQHAFVFWIVLAVFAILIGVWSLRTYLNTRRLESRLDEILGGFSADNVTQMLTEYLGTVRSTSASVGRMKEEHDRIAHLMPEVIRHVGLVRFSPFHDTGGDQSFTLAMLDGRGDGVVITALHSRSDSRLYAKPLEHGTSSYSLTAEEREAMNKALSSGSPSPVR